MCLLHIIKYTETEMSLGNQESKLQKATLEEKHSVGITGIDRVTKDITII